MAGHLRPHDTYNDGSAMTITESERGEEPLEWMISVDDHVLEPPDVWQDRVPARLRDRAPQIVRHDGEEVWLYDGERFPTTGLFAVAGKETVEFSPLPITYEEMRPGCYDPVARLEDMDRSGVIASLNFPSFPRFCGQRFSEGDDPELGFACLQAWNDWMIEEWCAAAPGRYMALCLIPLGDPELAAREIERCAARGCHGVAFSENPSKLSAGGRKLPSIHDEARYWDPVFGAAQETDLPLCIHVGSSSTIPQTSPDAPLMAQVAYAGLTSPAGTLTDWIFSGNLTRFPRLKICLSEGGIGWVAPMLERCEQVWDKQRHWAARMKARMDRSGTVTVEFLEEPAFGDHERTPTQIFKDQIFGCFFEDFLGVQDMKKIGALDNIMIESDYPHSDSTWPDSLQLAHQQVAGLTAAEKFNVLQGNAMRVHDFEPVR